MLKRREFLGKLALTSLTTVFLPKFSFSKDLKFSSYKFQYNGLRLPDVWPPRDQDPSSYHPMSIPYLESPPRVVPIDVGRQLFVDDFLIETTTLSRVYHNAEKLKINPILEAETELEKYQLWGKQFGNAAAVPKDGGVWWDPQDQVFKMWYEAGWLQTMAYAISEDGIHWERPDVGIQPGSNRILPELTPDSTTVFLDHFTSNPAERFKMLLRTPTPPGGFQKPEPDGGYCMVSPDGIHWSAPVKIGPAGDKTTMFYNPFRKKWVYSLRSSSAHGRARSYREHDDFMQGASWSNQDTVFWLNADELDLPDPVIGSKAQLYNFSAVGYESLMLGLHEIHLGPPNPECARNGSPKITDLKVSFSRDGFHWDRPNRDAFIASTRNAGDWDRGYVQSVGGICTVVGDELWFYYSGFQGNPDKTKQGLWISGMYDNGSTGIATLRRDGFASMQASGEPGVLTTRLVTFGGKNLFVNVDCPQGEFRAEVLDKNGSVIAPFSVSNCIGLSQDSTIAEVKWKDGEDLSVLIGEEVRFKFYLKNGKLFSFWVSPDQSGASHGYNAAGGPGFQGGKDLEGVKAYEKARPFHLT